MNLRTFALLRPGLNFHWIIDGTLGGSRGPSSRADLLKLKKKGIGALVRLVEPHESRLTGNKIRETGLEDYNEPVKDHTAPTPQQIDSIIQYIDEHLVAGVPVNVSCNAGIGRSGTVLACYLVHQGLTTKDALKTVNEKRGIAPDTTLHRNREQINAIETYRRRELPHD